MEYDLEYANFLIKLSSHNPLSEFPLKLLAERFNADAATYWTRDEESSIPNITWIESYKFPELPRESRDITIGEISDLTPPTSSNDYLFEIFNREQAKEQSWFSNLPDELKNYDFQNVIISTLFASERLKSLIIIYYKDKIPDSFRKNLFQRCIQLLNNITQSCLREHRSSIIEQRKIAHEMARITTGCRRKSEKLTKRLRGNLGRLVNQDFVNDSQDLTELIRVAISAQDSTTFIEQCKKRAQLCSFINAREYYEVGRASIPSDAYSFTAASRNTNSISPNLEIKIHEVDYTLLISNLVGNAFKYSKPGGIVTVKSLVSGGSVKLVVSNISDEIDHELWQKVWRYKYRGPNSDNVKGDGIGLSVVSDLCFAYEMKPDFSQRKKNGQIWTDVTVSFKRKFVRGT